MEKNVPVSHTDTLDFVFVISVYINALNDTNTTARSLLPSLFLSLPISFCQQYSVFHIPSDNGDGGGK